MTKSSNTHLCTQVIGIKACPKYTWNSFQKFVAKHHAPILPLLSSHGRYCSGGNLESGNIKNDTWHLKLSGHLMCKGENEIQKRLTCPRSLGYFSTKGNMRTCSSWFHPLPTWFFIINLIQLSLSVCLHWDQKWSWIDFHKWVLHFPPEGNSFLGILLIEFLISISF